MTVQMSDFVFEFGMFNVEQRTQQTQHWTWLAEDDLKSSYGYRSNPQYGEQQMHADSYRYMGTLISQYLTTWNLANFDMFNVYVNHVHCVPPTNTLHSLIHNVSHSAIFLPLLHIHEHNRSQAMKIVSFTKKIGSAMRIINFIGVSIASEFYSAMWTMIIIWWSGSGFSMSVFHWNDQQSGALCSKRQFWLQYANSIVFEVVRHIGHRRLDVPRFSRFLCYNLGETSSLGFMRLRSYLAKKKPLVVLLYCWRYMLCVVCDAPTDKRTIV